jgi:hypothetical protein
MAGIAGHFVSWVRGRQPMHDIATRAGEFERLGRLWMRAAIPEEELRAIAALMPAGGRPGARIAATGGIVTILSHGALGRALTGAFPGMRAVRLVAFNKTSEGNWGVPWHQDRIIAVRARHECAGFGNWSRKAGHWHCEPPARILQEMLFVRVHLDDCDADNGAMEIACGSHRLGAVDSSDAQRLAADFPAEVCAAERGDVLVLKMLTLHRSLPARAASSRRALRIDYASAELPPPLDWAG